MSSHTEQSNFSKSKYQLNFFSNSSRKENPELASWKKNAGYFAGDLPQVPAANDPCSENHTEIPSELEQMLFKLLQLELTSFN